MQSYNKFMNTLLTLLLNSRPGYFKFFMAVSTLKNERNSLKLI